MYCQVIVDIAHTNLDRLFTYLIPDGLSVVPGSHVRVPFGPSNRSKEGFVIRLLSDPDPSVQIKPLLGLATPYPVLLPDQIDLAHWMKKSYNCLLVDALRLMIPPQLRGGRVHEKVVRTVRPNPGADLSQALRSLVKKDGSYRSEKQAEVIRFFQLHPEEIPLPALLGMIPSSRSAVDSLVRREVLLSGGSVQFRRPGSGSGAETGENAPVLSESQLDCVRQVVSSFGSKDVFLLHGVTGSGKTEVYMHCIESCLARGRGAVMLVPEIALTPQTMSLFTGRFGDQVAVLHSGLSAGERFDEWRRIRLGLAKVVVGPRSAVFAPVPELGLIVVDEEHEPTYQSETMPHYHAVDVAAHRAAAMDAPVLLGSATPSLLSYFRAESGRYRLLRLPRRIGNRPLPDIEVVDMRQEFLSGNNGIFSARLLQRMRECLGSGKQAMLFMNRRGYSTFVSCRACGYTVQCPNCDLSMTYHKSEEALRCHFCGASRPVPSVCPNCGKPFIKYFGIGTEQIEEAIRKSFPEAVPLRIDTDTTRRKGSLEGMLSSFRRGDANVMIGTQMIAKGHDFPNVTLVGVVAADASLFLPDYRSTERTFQLLAQVAGRAGRDLSPGRVVIQTYHPEHPVIRFAQAQDYPGFYRYEMNERRKALFPPFTLFVRLLFSGPGEEETGERSAAYASLLESELGRFLDEDGKKDLLIFHYSPAPIRRRQGLFRFQILLKFLRSRRMPEILRFLYAFTEEHRSLFCPAMEINPQDMF